MHLHCAGSSMGCLRQLRAAAVVTVVLMATLTIQLGDCASAFVLRARSQCRAGLFPFQQTFLLAAGTYTIQSGDTCYNIAAQNGLTLTQFQSLNPGIQCDSLQVGTTVNLSGSAATTPTSPSETSPASPESNSQTGVVLPIYLARLRNQ